MGAGSGPQRGARIVQQRPDELLIWQGPVPDREIILLIRRGPSIPIL